MTQRHLSAQVEEALAALAADAAAVDRAALEELAQVMDPLAADGGVDAVRCAALARGLREVLGDDVARALTDQAQCPADIAARFFRLRQLASVIDALSGPRC